MERSAIWILCVSVQCFLGIISYGESSLVNGNALYVSNGTHIQKINRMTGRIQVIYFQREGQIFGLATDIDDFLLFWSDNSKGHRSIFRSWLDGTAAESIVQDVEDCYGISVDWISNHIYWTDARKQTIEVANYDGNGRRILIGYGLDKPRGIIVDPVFGYIFWADQGSEKIERTLLDGSDRKVLVNKHLHWPNQLAISYSTRRLYWVDQGQQKVMSTDIKERDINVERDLTEITSGDPVFGLVVIGNTAIFSTWFSAKVHSTLVATRIPLWKQEATLSGSRELYSLVATALSMQPPSFHPCGQDDRGGCSHLCLPNRGTSYRCACPSFGGLALSFNGKSCEVPSELLFFTLKDSGDVGFISLTGAQSPDLTLTGRSSSPSAVTYDPIEQEVYWSDVKENAIYRASLDGSEKAVFLNCTHGIGIVDGLAVDWVARQLYFTNMGQSAPGLDGAVYSWHQIEMISLDGRKRKTVVSDVERPRGLDLDIRNGFLFYGDWGKHPKIVQSWLDGSNGVVILDSGLSNPNGLTLYNGRLYVADSNFNNLTTSPHLMVYDVAKAVWQQLKLSANVSLPMGLAVRGDTLYYTDWVSIGATKPGYVKSYDLRFGVDNNVILSGQRPTGLHYSPLARRQKPVDASCNNAICSHDCVRVPSSPAKPFKCQCPDQSSKILASNQATCDRPENFLLFADLNTLKLTSLDPDSEEGTHTLLYSDIKSNFVAVAFDDTTDTIYWSDLTRKAIFSSPFNDMEPHLVYESIHNIDGLAVDTDRQRLFWTGYVSNGTGVIARMNLQRGNSSYHEIITGLNNPRAILHIAKKKLLFWTEYGGKNSPPSVHKSRANGKHHKMIMSSQLFWPNALAVQDDRLYVGDGSGKVFLMKFDGKRRKELTFLTGSVFHIFGMVVFKKVLFYSDWYTNSVYMVDMITGEQDTVASHLSRPTNVVIYHPADLSEENQCSGSEKKCSGSENQCSGSEKKCTDICIPLPRSYHCACPVGSKLASDGRSCIEMENEWELTDDFRCDRTCGEHASCAQLIPLLKYECVCKGGYHGNGKTCKACGKDFFRPFLGNGTCMPCPVGMTTRGVTTASECICYQENAVPVNGICVGKRRPRTARQEFSLTLNGPCNTNDTTWKSQLSTDILYVLEARNVCLLGECCFTGFTIQCGTAARENRQYFKNQFRVKWNIIIDNSTGFSRSHAESVLLNIKLKLMKLVGALGVHIPQYTTIPGTFKTLPLQWVCYPGEMIHEDGCVPILGGGLDNTTHGHYTPCPHGFYTSHSLNTTCEPCMNRLTVETTAVDDTGNESTTYSEQVTAEIIIATSTETQANTDQSSMPFGMGSFEVTEDETESSVTTLAGTHDVDITTDAYAVVTDIVQSEISTKKYILMPEVETEVEITAVGRPTFHGCPHGTVMVLPLPPHSNQIQLPISSWSAKDSYGNQLPITSNYPIIDEHISLQWVSNGAAGKQTVVFQAEDNWKQKTTCQFQVLIDDMEPPKFKYCPKNLVIKTSRHSEHVRWLRPVAMDNVEVASLIGTHRSDTEFQQGSTKVNYTALDKAGNAAVCNFTITVIQEQKCNLPVIQNGNIVCGSDLAQVDKCYISCQNDFTVSPLAVFLRPFNCMIVEDIVHLTTMLKTQEPCLRKRKPTTVRQEFSLTFNGPCNANDTALKSQLSTDVLEYLEARNLCLGAECRFSMMTIHCGPTSSKKRRYVDDQFRVKWNITIESSTGFSRSQVESILLNIKLELMKLAAALAVIVHKQQYTTVPGTVKTSPLQWVCYPGEMIHEDGCVPCPPGTLHNTTVGHCMLCPRGYFQPQDSQITCEPCTEGFTKEEGAVSAKLCVSFPSIDEMSKFLIITACTFGFVFLCMVIFMYTQYQRQQKQARKSLALANSSRYMMPNIYVAPPPIPKPKYIEDIRDPRDYIGSHDYEDIDGAVNTKAHFEAFYRIPRSQRESVNSFKTASDIIYRIPPSPSPRESTGTNSFKASDDTLVPNSPRESNRSFKLSNEGFYNYKPPMSPRTSTTNSFRSSPDSQCRSPQSLRDMQNGFQSPPESPYRSPHLSRDMPNTFRTSPEISRGSPHTQKDIPNSFKSLPDSPYRSPILPRDAQNSFKPLSDCLYKRPPSPISPSTSSRVSSDSLYKAPSTPRASPNASRARLEAIFRTPPTSRTKRMITENSCYEYE